MPAVAPPIPAVNGQTLVDLANAFLGGYQNAVDEGVLLTLLNEGKNEVWMILKSLRADWFMQSSQNTDSNLANFFAPLNSAKREFPLPSDYHEMKFIEVLDAGFEDVEFIYRDMATSEWKEQRRANTNQAPNSTANLQYHYDIVGKNTMILAEYPQIGFNAKLWYVRMVPDFSIDDPVDEIVYPYGSKIAMYATKLLMLTNQDTQMWTAWKEEWKEAVQRIAMSASPRQIADTVYVESWDGTPADSMAG